MKKAEIVFILLSILAIVFNFLAVPGGVILTFFSLLSLSLIYFYFGFALFNNIRFRKIFKKESYTEISRLRLQGTIGAGLALSAATIGIMFKVQSWPGGVFITGLALFATTVLTVVVLAKFRQTNSNYYRRILIRSTVLWVISLIFVLAPANIWLELKYREYPAYLEALKNAAANPENRELWEKVELEKQKINDEKYGRQTSPQ